MNAHLLDFEKPIAELESKLKDMQELAQANNVDVDDSVAALEEKIDKLKKDTYKNLTRWQKVQLSRHPERPYTLDYIHAISDKFIELHGDRHYMDDPAMVGGLAEVDGQSLMFIGQQKGRNTKERQKRRFGMPNPEGYRKALRLMKMADKFGVPIVTFIDTPGAFPGIEAEERGQGEAIARNLKEMFSIEVPILCIVIGEGASGGALGIAIGDRVLMLENTWYSVISPESCSSILWRSWEYKERAADALRLTSDDMKGFGLIDAIIEEPLGGAHTAPLKIAHQVKQSILKEVKDLLKIEVQDRINQRIEKFGRMGAFSE